MLKAACSRLLDLGEIDTATFKVQVQCSTTRQLAPVCMIYAHVRMTSVANINYWWWHSIVVRLPVLAGELSLSCARLTAGRVATLWVKRPLSVNQNGQLSQPSLWGR